MAKKKEEKISKKRQQFDDGESIVNNNPLFRLAFMYTNIIFDKNLGKNITAKVDSSGNIHVNIDCDKTSKEWAYIIAHCYLHIFFGHFEAEHMPGYWQRINDDEKVWVNSFDARLWNIACDIYVSRFLLDFKFGVSDIAESNFAKFRGTPSEIEIYEKLLEDKDKVGYEDFGTAGTSSDMIGLDKPIRYRAGEKSVSSQFASHLTWVVKYIVRNTVKSEEKIERHFRGSKARGYSRLDIAEAAEWFINQYPLLGGIATGFDIIDTSDQNNTEHILVAAVDVVNAKIIVNSAVNLNFEEWKFVLAHEYLHAGLQHHARRQGRDHWLWNIACDFVINNWLIDMNIGKMPRIGLLYDDSLKNMSAEEIYDILISKLKTNKKYDTFGIGGKGDIIDDGWQEGEESVSLDDFCRSALQSGLEYHVSSGRGYVPAGLIEEIKALLMPPIPWDVELAKLFDTWFPPHEKHRSYAHPSRRQSSSPDIPRPGYVKQETDKSRTYAVIIDTSGSMSAELIGKALGAAVSYSVEREVEYVRVVFCDAAPYDIGYVSPEDIAGRVEVTGRGGTVLKPAVELIEKADDFPADGPILIITDAEIEDDLKVKHEHAFLIPTGRSLPFRAKGKVFYFS